jgi:hypothetical protein
MGPTPGELVVFLHISDTHLSSYYPERGENFQRFCSSVIPLVNPAFVIHTGDVTDGLTKGLKGHQHEEDWSFYRKTLEVHIRVTNYLC